MLVKVEPIGPYLKVSLKKIRVVGGQSSTLLFCIKTKSDWTINMYITTNEDKCRTQSQQEIDVAVSRVLSLGKYIALFIAIFIRNH